MPSSWELLQANPPNYLNQGKTKVRIMAPGDGEKWISENVKVPQETRLKDKDDALDRTGSSFFKITEYTAWKNILRTNLELNADQKTLNLNVGKAGAVSTYYLPWKSGHGYLMKLGGGADLFITAPLNGCALIIGGSRREPIVVHANLDSYELDDALDPRDFGATAENQLAVYSKFYGNLAIALAEGRHVTGDDVRVFGPSFYLVDAGMMSAFGVRKNDEWTFYYNLGVTKPHPARPGAVVIEHHTGVLWPNLTDYK